MIRLRNPYPPTRLGFTADGRHLFVGDRDAVWYWDWAAAAVADRVAAPVLGMSPDGGYVLGRRAGRCAVTAWPGGELVGALDLGLPEYPHRAAVAPDGSEAVLDPAYTGWLEVWDVAAGSLRPLPRLTVHHPRYSPGGRWVFGTAPRSAVLLDRSARWDRVAVPAADWPGAAAVAPDDATAAVVGRAVNTVVLYALPGGRELRRLRGHRRSVWAVAFAPDGRRALTGGVDGTVRVWDVGSGECGRVFDWRLGAAGLVAWSPDGTTCAAANWTGEVVVWDVEG